MCDEEEADGNDGFDDGIGAPAKLTDQPIRVVGAGRDHEDPRLVTQAEHEEDHGPPERRRVHDDVAGIAAHAGHCGEGEEDADDKTHADLFAAACAGNESKGGRVRLLVGGHGGHGTP